MKADELERLAEAAHGAHNHELMKMDLMIQRRPYGSLPERSKVVYREIALAVVEAHQQVNKCDHSAAKDTDDFCPKCMHHIG